MSKCRYCLTTTNLTIDHKVPISLGGSDRPNNLQTLCRFCNQAKSNMSHKQVLSLFKWHNYINQCRVVEKGKWPI